MSTSDDDTIWNDILYNLKLQMTQATFDTWLKTSELISQEDDHLAVAVRSQYAVDWLSTRLNDTILRTAERIIGHPVQVTFVVADNGKLPQDDDRDVESADADIRPDCRIAVELINFDPLRAGFVMTSNYAWQYWQPYLAARERETGALNTGVAFCLWNTLRSFPAAWAEKGRPHWPSICTLADMVAMGNRYKLLGRNERGKGRTKRRRVIGVFSILEDEHIVWVHPIGMGRDIIYHFRVLDNLPLLTPVQISKLSPRLQERHAREIERCRLEFEQWQQLSLPTLLGDE
jgi:hypothetical protein